MAQPPSDCAYSSNTAGMEYDPDFVMEVPVVFHVISTTTGTGDISDQVIHNQMAHMNDSFSGALNANGVDSMIRFVLASEDPNGQATTGITRTSNNNWFNDSGNYADQLSWDSNRYLNVYTLNPLGGGGVIGYVPNLPQSGIVGTTNDGVRMLHSAIDSNTFRHVISHEIGHHFGLYHTFEGCPNSDCQTQGDLICDTNPHFIPTQNCGSNVGNCGGQPVPGSNFMNYQNISCVWEFTLGQIQRMRCTLEHWRPLGWSMPGIGTNHCQSNANSSGQPALISAEGSESIASNDFTLIAELLPANQSGIFYYGTRQTQLVFGNGFRCVADNIVRRNVVNSGSAGRLVDVVDLLSAPNIAAGATLSFQAWFRDPMGSPTTFDLSDGLEVTFQP